MEPLTPQEVEQAILALNQNLQADATAGNQRVVDSANFRSPVLARNGNSFNEARFLAPLQGTLTTGLVRQAQEAAFNQRLTNAQREAQLSFDAAQRDLTRRQIADTQAQRDLSTQRFNASQATPSTTTSTAGGSSGANTGNVVLDATPGDNFFAATGVPLDNGVIGGLAQELLDSGDIEGFNNLVAQQPNILQLGTNSSGGLSLPGVSFQGQPSSQSSSSGNIISDALRLISNPTRIF